ncbi:Inactive rhomboid protein 1 [Lamellibrachia satsuma]|nr:Inactive rhomboid protein 1 [Lamellibrachia satsuma]
MAKRLTRDAPQLRAEKPSVLPAILRYFLTPSNYSNANVCVSSCVALDWQKQEKRSQRKPDVHSRSFTPRSMALYEKANASKGINGEEIIDRELFFDLAVGTGGKIPLKNVLPPIVRPQVAQPVAAVRPSRRRVAPHDARRHTDRESQSSSGWNRGNRPQEADHRRSARPPGQAADDDDVDWVPDFLEDMFENSDRHAVGLGLLEYVFGSSERSQVAKKERTRRPYFTYWVTFIQVVIFIVTVSTYGFAPVGLDVKEVTAEVRMTSLSIEQVSIIEKRNMWVGPRQSDLIHLGAKYTPCMRFDPSLEAALAADSALERQTACCVYNDNSGCVQTLEKDCSPTLSTWLKWTPTSLGYQNRTSGSVCGEDPKFSTVIKATVTTTQRHHHSAPPPLSVTTTQCHHHSASSPLSVTTTQRHHHSVSSPLSVTTTQRHHHSASSPLSVITTQRHRHSVSSSTCVSTLSSPLISTNINIAEISDVVSIVDLKWYCASPASTGSFIWKDDITEWPVCDTALNVTASDDNHHMTCEVVGRPCCVGIQGECIVSTREYCQFRRGYFHEEASLCSQVGMTDMTDMLVAATKIDMLVAATKIDMLVAATKIDMLVAATKIDMLVAATKIDMLVAATKIDMLVAATKIYMLVAATKIDMLVAATKIYMLVAATKIDMLVAATKIYMLVAVTKIDILVFDIFPSQSLQH